MKCSRLGAVLLFMWVGCLLMGVTSVYGSSGDLVQAGQVVETELSAESGGMARFTSGDFFQPSKIKFMLNGRPVRVGVLTLVLEGVPIYTASYQKYQEGDRHILDTTLVSAGDRQVKLRSMTYDNWPGMRFSASGYDSSFTGMDMMVYGLDRLVFQENGNYSVVPLGNSCGLRIQGDHIVLQNTVSQEGLIISAPAGAWFEFRSCRLGYMVRAYEGLTRAPGKEFTVDIEAFQGDAMIAMGTAGRRGAAFCGNKSYWEEPKLEGEPSVIPSDWEWFPDRGRAFKALMADPKEARVRFGFSWNRDWEQLEDVAVGGDVGLLYKRFTKDDQFSLTGRGLLAARFDVFSESFDLLNTDYLYGLAAGYQHGVHSVEMFVYHQSSHLGDEIEERGDAKRIDYGRETARALYSYQYDRLRLYGGPSFTFHALPEDLEYTWWLQTGAEYFFDIQGQQFYGAADIKSKQEHDWTLDATLQVGWFIGNPVNTRNRQWIFAEYYNGYSNMGQFWNRWEEYGLIGAAYQWQ